MFTQCSKCETVFRLSAEALRAAGGQVRCGRCGEVFNALARLAEDADGFVKGESSLDLETRADEILESIDEEAPEPIGESRGEAEGEGEGTESVAPPGTEIARLQILDPLDEDPGAETSLEFTLPPGELDRIFIETRPSPLHQLTVEHVSGEHLHSEAIAPTQDLPPHPERQPAPQPDPSAAQPPMAVAAATERAAPGPGGPARESAPLTRVAGLEVSEDVRREMLKSYSHAELPEINAPRRRLPFVAWLTAAIVLGLLLAVQLMVGNGEWLSAHTRLLVGSGVPPASLSSYQLRQWGVTGDPAAQGTLRVRASIMNVAGQLQPYPLLRVTLANRFGARVGSREFGPSEYLGKPTARMLAPGERVDAVLDILDPGKDAEGFEIDVCLRDAEKKIHCAGDAAPQTP